MFIFIIALIIIGIITVQNRYETEGLGKAFKSLFCLFIALIALGLCATGTGAILGVPMMCIARTFSKGV